MITESILPTARRWIATLLVTAAPIALAAAQGAGAPVRLSLGDAARLAARQSAQVNAARLRTDEARARVTQRRADLLPTVSASAAQTSHTFNTATFGIQFPSAPGQPPLFSPNGQVEGPVNLLDVRARASQTLFDPAARDRVRSAGAAVTASSADADVVAEQAAAQAATAYVRAQRAEAQLGSRMEDSTLAAGLLTIARDQLAAGVGIALDVTRAQAQLSQARAQLVAARNERDRAHLDLIRATGLEPGTTLALSDSLPSPDESDMQTTAGAAVEVALRSRADVRAAAAVIEAAEAQLTAIRAERKPTIGAFADEGLIGTGPTHLLSTYDLGIQISASLFEGRRRDARAEEQSLVIRELDFRRRDLARQIELDVRSALLDLGGAREQVAAARERVSLGDQELRQARDRFSAGVAGNADVITASLSLTSARALLVDALAAYQSARVALARSQGTLVAVR